MALDFSEFDKRETKPQKSGGVDFSQFDKEKEVPQAEPTIGGFALGNINKGIAQLAGLPVQTAENLVNLGIAGYGTAKGIMGGKDLPETISGSVGGPQWIEEKMRKYMPSSFPAGTEPQSRAGQYGAAILQNLPGALLTPGTIAQIPAKAAGATTSAIGGQLGSELGGAEGAAIGSMFPGIRKVQQKSPTEIAEEGRKAEAFQKSKELGIPVMPHEMKVDKVQMQINDAINKELGQPLGTEITPKTLNAYNKEHYTKYEDIIKSPSLTNGIVPNKDFNSSIAKIGDDIERMRTELPETYKSMKPIVDKLRDYGYGGFGQQKFTPDTTINAIRKLRRDSAKNYQSNKPAKVEMGSAEKKIAESLEKLVEDNLPKGSTELKDFRNARTAIAKSHAVESSLDTITRKVSGAKLSVLLTEGTPLTGKLQKLAEVSGEFPESAKPAAHEGYFTHKTSPMAMGHPEAMGAHWLSKLTRPITTSSPYQSLLVDPRAKLTPEQERYLRYLMVTQAQQRNQNEIPPK